MICCRNRISLLRSQSIELHFFSLHSELHPNAHTTTHHRKRTSKHLRNSKQHILSIKSIHPPPFTYISSSRRSILVALQRQNLRQLNIRLILLVLGILPLLVLARVILVQMTLFDIRPELEWLDDFLEVGRDAVAGWVVPARNVVFVPLVIRRGEEVDEDTGNG
jgi:hypothetical protein